MLKKWIKQELGRALRDEPANDRPPQDSDAAGFYVPPGYVSRREPKYYDDATPEHLRKIYQPDVYALAGVIASLGTRAIVDVGCGRGHKLRPFGESGFDVVGIDYGPNIAYCRSTHGFGRWFEFDFESTSGCPLDEIDVRNRVIICADVIEHLKSPLPLLDHLKRAVDRGGCVLLSTPERELLPGGRPEGPPKNPAHVREWAMGELRALLASREFPIPYLGLTAATDVTRHMTTILAVLHHSAPAESGARA